MLFNKPQKKLRLIIGCGRSGTSWVSNVISKTSTPVNFFHEPLYWLKPKLPFNSQKYDHTAIGLKTKKMHLYDPLLVAYKLFTLCQIDWKKIGVEEKIRVRHTDNSSITLIKEVHSLLGVPALLSTIEHKSIILIRNPLYVADSLFHRDGIDSIYLNEEYEYIKVNMEKLCDFLEVEKSEVSSKLETLDSYESTSRFYKIAKKLFVISLLNTILLKTYNLSRNILLVQYEKILENIDFYFEQMTRHLDLDYSDEIKYMLKYSNDPNVEDLRDPHSIKRSIKDQKEKPLKFISLNEKKKIEKEHIVFNYNFLL